MLARFPRRETSGRLAGDWQETGGGEEAAAAVWAARLASPGGAQVHVLAGASMAAAAHGAQWVVQSLRGMSGESGTMPPMPQSTSISFGTLGRLELLTEAEG